ncbi:MAG: PQQ-dependent sugar dehydrogenase, partial [Acidobacteriota bacterium]|nr:PQQ-dependent sugar dehydrogenase [Acidobacteriota bacterium]
MIRTRPVSIVVGLAVLAGTPILGQLPDSNSEHQSTTGVFRSVEHNYRLVTVADNLEHPWAIAFLPDGDVLVTERPGRLRIIRNDTLLPDSVPGVPEVLARGQGGLMDVVPHPDFALNRFLYLSYSKPTGERQATTAVIRGRFENDTLTDVEEIFVAVSQGNGHYGCRLAFDPDGYLFITTGDRQAPPRGDLATHPAQDLS